LNNSLKIVRKNL